MSPRVPAVSRRRFLAGLGAAGVGVALRPSTAGGAAADAPTDDAIGLRTIPRRVIKAPESGRSNREGWLCYLLVTDARDRDLTPERAVLLYYAGEDIVRTEVLRGAELDAITRARFRRAPHHAPLQGEDELFDIALRGSVPAALGVDRVVVSLRLRGPSGPVRQVLTVPVTTYQTRTPLRFPFRGAGIVLQGPVQDNGHTSWSEQFAIDVSGLNLPTYAIMTGEDYVNENLAGWGRQIVAPADGVVVYARNDVPDQPAGNPDPASWRSLPDPGFAQGGNQVIIDHGTGEFSAINHLQMGSVSVRRGARVEAGQGVGRLGNSGNSFGPHLHYHLQAGPVEFASDPLPLAFTNVRGPLHRGTFFVA